MGSIREGKVCHHVIMAGIVLKGGVLVNQLGLPYAGFMFDVHCHVDALPVLTQAMERLISSGIKPSSWAAHRQLACEHSLNMSLGLHPFFVFPDSQGDLDLLETYLNTPSVVALGEIGLDYHEETLSDRKAQQQVFSRQLEFAVQRDLPVILHCRKAHDDGFSILSRFDLRGVVFHAFSGHEQDHKRAMDRGDMLSFGFAITYRDNKKQTLMLMATPLDRILFETDSPYMKRLPNEKSTPNDIQYVYEAAAKIKEIPLEDLVEQINDNIRRVFGL